MASLRRSFKKQATHEKRCSSRCATWWRTAPRAIKREGMAKILLVEDNEMNRDMLSRRLQRRGYEVVLAVDGQSGVEMAQSQAPDLVLMDMSLQVVDGWEAARRLKAGVPTKHIPIIALTAHA